MGQRGEELGSPAGAGRHSAREGGGREEVIFMRLLTSMASRELSHLHREKREKRRDRFFSPPPLFSFTKEGGSNLFHVGWKKGKETIPSVERAEGGTEGVRRTGQSAGWMNREKPLLVADSGAFNREEGGRRG
jgi:hypothetical protein